MICRLCQAQEPYPIRFGDYGTKPFWCKKCQRRHREAPQTLVVPLGRFQLSIESLFRGFSLDEMLVQELWMKAEKLLKKALSQPRKTTIILWYDPALEEAAPIWLRMFEGMGDICLLTLFEVDPLRWSNQDT